MQNAIIYKIPNMIKHILENTKENVMAVSEGSQFMEIKTDEKIIMVFDFVIKIDGEGTGLCGSPLLLLFDQHGLSLTSSPPVLHNLLDFLISV